MLVLLPPLLGEVKIIKKSVILWESVPVEKKLLVHDQCVHLMSSPHILFINIYAYLCGDIMYFCYSETFFCHSTFRVGES